MSSGGAMSGRAIGALAAAAVAVFAVIGYYWFGAQEEPVPEPVVVVQPQPDPAPVPAPEPEPEPEAVPEPEPEAAPEPDILPEPEPEPEAASVPAPRFDVVRVDAQGSTVVAGVATAGARVLVLVDGVEAAEALADRRGSFVSLFTLPESAAPRVLTLEALLDDGKRLESEETVLLAPTLQVAGAAPPPDVDEHETEVVPETPAADGEGEARIAEAPLEPQPAPQPAPATGEAAGEEDRLAVVAEAGADTPAAMPDPAAAAPAPAAESALTAADDPAPQPDGAVAAAPSPPAAPEPAARADTGGADSLAPAPVQVAEAPAALTPAAPARSDPERMAESLPEAHVESHVQPPASADTGAAVPAEPEIAAEPTEDGTQQLAEAPARPEPDAADEPARDDVEAPSGPEVAGPGSEPAPAETAAAPADGSDPPEPAPAPDAPAPPPDAAPAATEPGGTGADGRIVIAEAPAVDDPDQAVGAPLPGDGAAAPGTAPDLGASPPEALAELAEGAAPGLPSEASPPAVTTPARAPAVIMATGETARVVQAPAGDRPPEVLRNVVIETISYSPGGDVVLAGRGSTDRAVRLYLDNRPLGEVPVGGDGLWRADLPDIDTGVYTLRADEIDAGGRVTSRFETPFQREQPDIVAAAARAAAEAPERGARAEIITVQPGHTLWGISRRTYGRGILYVHVFDANRDQIRNPDLIYPGQIFTLPEIDADTPPLPR